MTLANDGSVSGEYAATFAAVQAASSRAVLAANSELIVLCWQLAQLILERQVTKGPRAKVTAWRSSDLRDEFPDMTGLSPGNLDYMRRLAAAWPAASLQLAGRPRP